MSEFPSPLYTKSKTPAVGDHLYDILGNDTGLTVGTLSGTTGFYVNRSITPATWPSSRARACSTRSTRTISARPAPRA